jgi:AcrR family transcriptional regulator
VLVCSIRVSLHSLEWCTILRVNDAVKPERRATRRQRQAEATQAEIVAAATRLFFERGYVATTVEAIAEEAGVALQTIYNAIGSKRAVLSRVLDFAAAGPEAPAPVPEFMRQRTAEIHDSAGFARLLADWFAEVGPRVAPVFRVIREAAAVDPEAAELDRQRAAQRLRNYTEGVASMQRRGILAGEAPDELAAAIWSIGHHETYRMLVVEQGWPAERYRSWVEASLSAVLQAARPEEVRRE